MKPSSFSVAPFAALTLACLLAACSGRKEEAEVQVATPPQPVQKTVFDTQLKALDKAKAVQGVVDQQKADADKKIKEQEEGGG